MSKKIPLRQCVGCGEMKSKREMLRVLKTENEGIIIDTLHTPYRWCGIIETINKTTKTIKIQEGW